MISIRYRALVIVLIGLAQLLTGCATTFEPQPIDLAAGPSDIHSASERDVTVSTTILSDDMAQQLYGVDLKSAGLQAIWLRIENRSEHAQWLLVSALDPNYYPPDEAAMLFRGGMNDEQEEALVAHFRKLAVPLKSEPGSVNEGYVLAPRHEGGRYVIVKLIGTQQLLDFGFAVTLPDGDFDFESLHPQRIYDGQDRPDIDLAQLRAYIRELPCCVRDKSGERDGDPLNLVIIGNIGEVLAAMSRAGWSFTHRIDLDTIQRMMGAAISGQAYPVAPVSPLYFMDRPQDMALQRARNTIVQRNHMRLWLAPHRYEGRSIWVGQISRDIAVKVTTKSPTLTTHVIDPNVDEAREHLLQSLLVAGAVERFGFAGGVGPASSDAPRSNLTEDPYFTDGLRLVAFLSSSGVTPPEEADFLEWRNSADPVDEGRQDSDSGDQ